MEKSRDRLHKKKCCDSHQSANKRERISAHKIHFTEKHTREISNVFPTMLGAMSLSNDLCNEQQPIQPTSSRASKMDEAIDKANATLFHSKDFGRFLSKEFHAKPMDSGPAAFLSKDSALPAFNSPLFKSTDSFSSMFATKEWEMKFSHEDIRSTPSPEPEDFIPKTFKTMASTTESTEDMEEPELVPTKVLQSGDWMFCNTLGNHVDVQYTPALFSSSDSDEGSVIDTELPPASLSPTKTDWNQLYLSQLMPPVSPVFQETNDAMQATSFAAPESAFSPVSAPAVAFEGQIAPQPYYPSAAPVALAIVNREVHQETQSSDPVEPQEGQKRKRKRSPRKKVEPKTKRYVEAAEVDVLLGRGGQSNHWPGNKRYREAVDNLKSWYREIDDNDKDQKTLLSQCLIDSVHEYEGRFLDHDANGWYEIENVMARRKVSQALREDNDPVKRAAKRQRFLAKRAREQAASMPQKRSRR